MQRLLVDSLLSWFSANARDLPWRRTRDPYAIWVSEIMLQQTQVKTVIPYWQHWMRELPTIQSAAKASPAKLHKLWEGLGYYPRVRNLQKAAQQIVTHHRGKFPEQFDDILALPGIGHYTAGAICSIAFNQPKPILDGNVIRVLTRIFGIATDPREKQTNAQLWQLAGELVEMASIQEVSASGKARPRLLPLLGERAGVRAVVQHKTKNACSRLNQALMELGALICTPRSPQCNLCPAITLCIARKKNMQELLPNLGKRKTATAHRFIAFIVERNAKFFARQRPSGVVNAHLWEFPNLETDANEGKARQPSARRSNIRESRRARSDAPCHPEDFHTTSSKPFCIIKHSITRYRITLEAWRAEFAEPRIMIPGRWLTLGQLHQLAFTSAHKKILARLSVLPEGRSPR